MQAILVLEDGKIFTGKSFGYAPDKEGIYAPLVFYTGVVGYQEVLTDPCYYAQIVVMTYPLIGNYGINKEDMESGRAQVKALIIKEKSRIVSNFRAEESLESFMQRNKVSGIEGIDTRALTVHLREQGEQWAAIFPYEQDKNLSGDIADLTAKIKERASLKQDPVKEVTCKKVQEINPCPQIKSPGAKRKKRKIVLLDLGAKNSLLQQLQSAGFHLIQVPAHTSAKAILSLKPDKVFLSSGPDYGADIAQVINEVKNLLGKVPVIGLDLGHLVLGQALGAKVKRLKCGHHGLNQPVRNILDNKTEITLQSHSFVLDEATLPEDIEITHRNLNDQSIEGLRAKKLPKTFSAFSLQFFPANCSVIF